MAGEIPAQLTEKANGVKAGHKPEATVREILAWFGYFRKGVDILNEINIAMERLGITTNPELRLAYIDSSVSFVSLEAPRDPMFRVRMLGAANRKPLSVAPNDSLEKAMSLMLRNRYSQLPVMVSDHNVKGIISLERVAQRLFAGKTCNEVRECMDSHYEISAEESIFEAVNQVIKHQCVLVRNEQNSISGIITTSDLSEEFHRLGEPFLLLGEIENHIRLFIRGKFSETELQAAKDPADTSRTIHGIDSLAFGEYVRLLEEPSRWAKVGLRVDRKDFVEQLRTIGEIRNAVMHFNPQGIDEEKLDTLRAFAVYIKQLREIHE